MSGAISGCINEGNRNQSHQAMDIKQDTNADGFSDIPDACLISFFDNTGKQIMELIARLFDSISMYVSRMLHVFFSLKCCNSKIMQLNYHVRYHIKSPIFIVLTRKVLEYLPRVKKINLKHNRQRGNSTGIFEPFIASVAA